MYGTKGELIKDSIYLQIFVLGLIHMPYFSRVQCLRASKNPGVGYQTKFCTERLRPEVPFYVPFSTETVPLS